jgi:2'-5' RNA ligase
VSRQKARLFTALELPDRVREELVSWRSEAVRELDGLRLIAPADLHVTLCFLGWQATEELDAIAAACAPAAAAAAGPWELMLGGAIWLPPRRARVLAVKLVDGQQRLRALQAALSAGLRAGGWYEPEKRPYRPHVTLARVTRRARLRPSELPAPPSLEFIAEQVTLFRSRLAPAGARYEAVARMAIG